MSESPEDPRSLVRQVLAGERDAFDRLVLQYQKKVYRVAFGVLRSVHDAEDAVQEIFLRTYRYLYSYDPGRSFEGWLMGIALKHSRTFLSRRRSGAVTLDPARDSILESPKNPRVATVEKSVQDREMQTAALQAVVALPEKQREALLLYLNTDLTTLEIAEILGCSRGTAGVHLHRARATLRRLLGSWVAP